MTVGGRSTLIRAQHIVPVVGPSLDCGWVVIEGDTIRAIGDGPAPATDRIVDYEEAVVLPGFVNAHTHLGCAFLKGISEGSSFASWISESVAPAVIRGVADDPARVRAAARDAARELLEGGVTAVADSFFETVGRDALLDIGLRGVFFREHFGSMASSMEAAVAHSMQQVAQDVATLQDTERMGFGLAPHAPYTCPSDVLRALAGEAVSRNLLQTIHVAESAEETEFFTQGSGPFQEMFAPGDRVSRYALGQTPLAALEQVGTLGPRTLAVHCVHVDAADIDILRSTGTNVVHCPSSNLRLATGIAPIAAMQQVEINVCLGTDSPASTGKLDMFEEMRLSVLMQRGVTGRIDSLSPADALRMATLNGAQALGLGELVGSLEVGKQADLCVVDLSRARHRPLVDPLTTLVMSATPDDVVASYVAGRSVFARNDAR